MIFKYWDWCRIITSDPCSQLRLYAVPTVQNAMSASSPAHGLRTSRTGPRASTLMSTLPAITRTPVYLYFAEHRK